MNKQTQTAKTIAFYEQYVVSLTERLAEAHETIGRLRYHLERNGIELPQHLATKKKEVAMVVELNKINPKILLGDYSLN